MNLDDHEHDFPPRGASSIYSSGHYYGPWHGAFALFALLKLVLC